MKTEAIELGQHQAHMLFIGALAHELRTGFNDAEVILAAARKMMAQYIRDENWREASTLPACITSAIYGAEMRREPGYLVRREFWEGVSAEFSALHSEYSERDANERARYFAQVAAARKPAST